MIAGVVEAGREAVIELSVRGPDGREQAVNALIDTGFTGFLTLPSGLIQTLRATRIGRSRAVLADGAVVLLQLVEVDVDWDGAWRTVRANVVDTGALVGMGLLAGYRFCLDATVDGRVTIEALS
ncbi:MAG: clan AA aspartic protease [Dehalococcoidia bacterium]